MQIFKVCDTCELRNACARDNRCYRPRTLEVATRECKEANEALVAAVTRVNNAILALKQAMQAEEQS